jgi:pimeloyl-ACP methyl ester carboxylesterase
MDMHSFSANGVEIAYLDEGEGAPIVLVHGFASTAHVNWVHTGWVKTLVDAGRRVIALDNRGHGKSQKLYDEDDYQAPKMAADVLALIEHLKLEKADVMGYSMGARISTFAALAAPEKINSLIIGGMGIRLVHGVGGAEVISHALLAPSLSDIVDRTGQMFRAFAEQTGSDLLALAACIKATRVPISAKDVACIQIPTLIAVGSKDDVAGSPFELGEIMRHARVLEITGRDHMVAVGDKIYKQGVLSFLQG